MFSKLKRILHPENMLFKMIILNCGLLLLVTLILTAAGNYIYEESIAERSYANTMEIQNQVLKSLDLIFKSVEDNVEALGNYPEVQVQRSTLAASGMNKAQEQASHHASLTHSCGKRTGAKRRVMIISPTTHSA